MSEGVELEAPEEQNHARGASNGAMERSDVSEGAPTEEKDGPRTRQEYTEIKMEDAKGMEEDKAAELETGLPTTVTKVNSSDASPAQTQDKTTQNAIPEASSNTTDQHAPPPSKMDRLGEQSPGGGEVPNILSPRAPSGVLSHTRQRSDTQSSVATNGPPRSDPLSSMVFVVTALEHIAASKEARKRKPLGDAVKQALSAIKDPAVSPSPEAIFDPLRLATETSSIPLTVTALDCLGKLISYSYFSMPATSRDPSVSPSQPQQPPLIERAIETICDCFQDEGTPAEVQLQIVKSLLAAVLNDKIIVHGAGLLKAVRQIYNIFLISKSSTNQQVAQGTLTQMVGTVFERVKTRLLMKEARMNMSKLAFEKGTEDDSQADLEGSNSLLDTSEMNGVNDLEESSETASTVISDQPARKEPGNKLTLQSFENAKSFDDAQIGENAPTMVTRVKPSHKGLRTGSGQLLTAANGREGEERSDHELSDEDEEDEIYVKDAFLVFRSMCRLSTKVLPQDQQQDLKAQNMRSKLVSLAIIRTLLNNNMVVFTSPLVTIRSSSNNEPTGFGQAINQYLRLSLSRNGASPVRPVFESCCEIFWLILKDMRVLLKVRELSPSRISSRAYVWANQREIEVFLKEIYLAILERRNAPSFQKLYIMKILRRLSADPKALVEIYLNYDCDRTALDNIFQRCVSR